MDGNDELAAGVVRGPFGIGTAAAFRVELGEPRQ